MNNEELLVANEINTLAFIEAIRSRLAKWPFAFQVRQRGFNQGLQVTISTQHAGNHFVSWQIEFDWIETAISRDRLAREIAREAAKRLIWAICGLDK